MWLQGEVSRPLKVILGVVKNGLLTTYFYALLNLKTLNYKGLHGIVSCCFGSPPCVVVKDGVESPPLAVIGRYYGYD